MPHPLPPPWCGCPDWGGPSAWGPEMNLRATSLLIQLFSGITSFVLCLSGRERDKVLLFALATGCLCVSASSIASSCNKSMIEL
jgi:hypothetical protein